VFPQPSGTVPQFAERAAQFLGWHWHFCWAQLSPAVVHEPQSSAFPHPSSTVPHDAPSSGHVFGMQLHLPSRQGCPAGHAPHSIAPPQVSFCVPHVRF
jgi:hypothetical protein